ncbi:MAG TPA: acyl-CoA dehydrogenase [Acidimicrobiia bacterium]|nr:acyl-CoA dehydrogenase [Acidimicrobiia bacterium]
MAIGITEDHDALRAVVQRFVEREVGTTARRAALDAEADSLPPFWDALRALGWIGLHLDERVGGAGATLVEQAVVLEELGRACTPGPYATTVLAGAVLAELGAPDGILSAIASGAQIGAVALHGALDAEPDGGALRVSGTLRPVIGAHLADVLVVPVTCDGEVEWCALDAREVAIDALASVDPTRRAAQVRADGVDVPTARRLGPLTRSRVHDLAIVLAAAEAAGVAQWCVETAASYAADRVQFGRPIGQFQGVKHRCADMLCRAELARAAAWDAARAETDRDNGAALANATAGALAFEAAFQNAKDCIQTLGGVGFTWEHDAHLYLRRAMALHQMIASPHASRVRAANAARTGERRRLAVDLPDEAERRRAEVREFLAEIEPLDARERRIRLADDGYLTPAWPRPWGRDADALELLVIEEEFRAAKVARPSIMVGAWALPNLIVYGTQQQQDRWIAPTLRGEITWCQLFSEPGAGSDLAALATRATRVEGGWLLTGQKVWTSMAHQADWGICLARSDPDAPKHDGISCFMVDMRSPGIEVRPLRELTGQAMFNEVFLDDVFVPEDCLVGDEHDGWRCARTTLANERVYMGGSNTIGGGVVGVLRLVEQRQLDDDTHVLDEVGGLVVTAHALAVLGFRLTVRSLRGTDPSGSEASVRKLLGVQHDQRVQEVGMTLLGPDAVADDGDAAAWIGAFLFNRCLTIAGGTTDIQKNLVAERLLGLPRDP